MTPQTYAALAVQYVAKWRDRLRLQAWDVAVEIVPREQLSRPDNYGEIIQQPSLMRATIRIRHPEDHSDAEREDRLLPNPTAAELQDTVVHELLHLWLPKWQAAKGHEADLERAVTLITRALLDTPDD